jgi:4-amino-4-deoxychorismate lyase
VTIRLAPQVERDTALNPMVLVNGHENSAVSAFDRGLAYGDGVFRTLVVRGGVAQQWRRHYAKLGSDCAALGLNCPSAIILEKELAQVCEVEPDCVVKIMITRGVGHRGYRYESTIEPTRIVLSTPLPDYPQSYATTGVRVRHCRLRLAPQSALAGVKHLNRLENVIARTEWSDPAIAEGLLSDTDGNVIGGTMTNMFIAREGMLRTPQLDACGVAGVTRDRIMDSARARGVRCETASIRWDEVLYADEVVLVNSVAGAWPVCEIEGRARPVGPLARQMQHWLRADDDEQQR